MDEFNERTEVRNTEQARPAWVMPVIIIVGILVAGFIALMGLGAILVATDNAPEEAAPAPQVTVTEEAPEPEVTEDTTDADYDAAMRIVEIASKKSGGVTPAMCISWAIDRDKWTGKFARVITSEFDIDQDVAEQVVQDFFDRKCGT